MIWHISRDYVVCQPGSTWDKSPVNGLLIHIGSFSPHFHDEVKAFAFLESIVWADGVTCPHCGVIDGRVYDLAGVRSKASVKNRKASFVTA